MAHLLEPSDFGLLAIVVASTGVLMLLRDGGQTMAILQRRELDTQLLSSLFWAAMGVGTLLALLTLALAPAIAMLFDAPGLRGLTAAYAFDRDRPRAVRRRSRCLAEAKGASAGSLSAPARHTRGLQLAAARPWAPMCEHACRGSPEAA